MPLNHTYTYLPLLLLLPHAVSIPHYDKLLSAAVTSPGASAVSATGAGGTGHRDSMYGAPPPNTLLPTDASGGGGPAAPLPPVKISDGVLYIHLQILNASLINGMSKIVLKSLSGICKLFVPIFQSLNTILYSLFKTFITKVVQVRVIVLTVYMLRRIYIPLAVDCVLRYSNNPPSPTACSTPTSKLPKRSL